MATEKFEGVWTALITPFYRGEVDLQSLKELLQFQLENGVEGFVVNGTTGECPTLTKEEKRKILQFVISEVAGEVPVMFGSGTNSTAETVELSRSAVDWGAKSLLVVVPYYNKPPQRGLIGHFTTVANSVSVPLFLYNVPSRTVVTLNFESIQALSRVTNISGIKEATGDVKFGKKIKEYCGENFHVFSGDDASCVELAYNGSDGVISVLSHVIPQELVELHQRAREKDKSAVEEFRAFDKLTNLLFSEANPIPVKWAMKAMGIIRSDEVRLPLVPLLEDVAAELKREMGRLGIKK